MGVITLFVGERRPGIHIASTRLAMPIVDASVKCLIVSAELRSVCPEAFDFVARFAKDNDLPMEIRCVPKAGSLDGVGISKVAGAMP